MNFFKLFFTLFQIINKSDIYPRMNRKYRLQPESIFRIIALDACSAAGPVPDVSPGTPAVFTGLVYRLVYSQ